MAVIFRLARYNRSVFNSVFRQFFAAHQKFPWNANTLKSRIMIDEKFPSTGRVYPAIIIGNIVGGDLFEKMLDRGLQEETYEPQVIDGVERQVWTGERRGGQLPQTVEISVYSMDPFVAEEVHDELVTLISLLLFEKLRCAGIEITAISDAAPSEERVGNDIVHRYTLGVSFYAEWESSPDPTTIQTIEGIRIPDIGGISTFLTEDGVSNATFNSTVNNP